MTVRIAQHLLHLEVTGETDTDVAALHDNLPNRHLESYAREQGSSNGPTAFVCGDGGVSAGRPGERLHAADRGLAAQGQRSLVEGRVDDAVWVHVEPLVFALALRVLFMSQGRFLVLRSSVAPSCGVKRIGPDPESDCASPSKEAVVVREGPGGPLYQVRKEVLCRR